MHRDSNRKPSVLKSVLSSLFDILTYVLLFFVFCPAVFGGQFAAIADGDLRLRFISLFQTGWFIESMLTQIVVVYMLRSARLPIGKNAVSVPVFLTTICGVIFLTIVPYTFGDRIGLCSLPAIVWVIPVSAVLLYIFVVSLLKKLYTKHFGCLL